MFSVATLTHGDELTPLQQRTAFRSLGYDGVPADDTEIPPDDCLKLWVFMLIGRLGFLEPEQRTLLFEEIMPQLSELGSELLSESTLARLSRGTTPMVVIADTRYATWQDRTGWLDLSNGQNLEAPLHEPLETVAFNLAVLFRRNRAACTRIADVEAKNADDTR